MNTQSWYTHHEVGKVIKTENRSTKRYFMYLLVPIIVQNQQFEFYVCYLLQLNNVQDKSVFLRQELKLKKQILSKCTETLIPKEICEINLSLSEQNDY
jgi:hypothetical protein